MTRDEFLNLGYRFRNENGREKIYTPRHFKIDVYHSRDLNGISLDRIIETRKTFPVGKKGDGIKSICLEGLIVTKFRAKRDQDLEDLHLLAMYCSRRIDWDLLEALVQNDFEFKEIARTMKLYAASE